MMNQRLIRLFALATVMPLAAPALAQDDDVLGTVTISASAEPVDISRTGASVTVLTGEDLDGGAELSFSALLSRLPGVSFSGNGGMGTTSSLRIRGLAGYYVGARIDGIDVSDPSLGQVAFDFGGLTSAGLSRVEVLRGAQSALYGSSAIGGVIDITTFRPERDGVSGQVALEAGSDSTYSGTLSLGWRDARSLVALTATRTVTDGISAYADGTETDGFRASRLNFYGEWQASETVTLGAAAIAQRSHVEYDGFPAPAGVLADADDNADSDLRGARAFLRFAEGAFRHELALSTSTTERDTRAPHNAEASRFEGRRNGVDYSGGWDVNDQLSLNWGLDHARERYASASIAPWGNSTEAGRIETNAVWAEALYAASPDLDLSFALRHDDHSRFGGETSARAALAWRPDADWVIRAVAATGYRAPALYELYGSFGDDRLQPETSRSLELGAERHFAGGRAQVTLFEAKITDKIGWDNVNYRYAQISGDTRSRGVEIEAEADLAAGWQLFGNYTYTDSVTTNTAGRAREAHVPRHDLVLGLSARFANGVNGHVSVRHVADFISGGRKMPDYTTADLALGYEFGEGSEVYLRVENLLDEKYQTVRNYGQPGRQVFVGVRSSF